jgi:hypothetical protein
MLGEMYGKGEAMARKGLLATLVLAVVAMGVAPAPAKVRTLTQRYEVALYAYADHAEDPAGVTEDGRLEWGGVHFPAVGKKGRFSPKLTARDDIDLMGTGVVYISACQDVNGDGLCNNEGGDIRAKGCVGDGHWIRMAKARKALPISVIVYAVNTCPNRSNATTSATTGTVSMRWGKK